MVAPPDANATVSEPLPLSLDEPAWQSDSDCPSCRHCNARFSLANRRHHCRRCGVCACNDCCQRLLPLPRMGFVDPVRHCEACAAATQSESNFYSRQIRLLSAGCGFELTTGSEEAHEAGFVVCRLSPDQRYLQFEGVSAAKADPVPLLAIENCSIVTTEESDSSSLPCGFRLRWRNSAGETINAQVVNRRPETRRAILAWIGALQTAMRIVSDFKRRSMIDCSVDSQ